MKKQQSNVCELNSLTEQRKKAAKVFSIMFAVGSLFLLLIAILDFCQIRKWDKKIAEYDHVQGIITHNQRITKGRGKSRHTVTEIKYTYNYKGRDYSGDRVVYKKSNFPTYKKAGTKHEIIVNPENPTDSAAMIHYSSPAMKYLTDTILAIMSGICLICALFHTTRKISLPQQLLDHEKSFPPEKIEELLQRKLNFIDAPKFTLSGRIKFKYHRFAVITNSVGKISYIITFLLLFIALTGIASSIFSNDFHPKMLILLIPIAVPAVIIFCFRSGKVFFDLVEKYFYKSKKFHHGKVTEYHNFSDIEFFCIIPQTNSKGHITFVLYAVKKDNTAISITAVPVTGLKHLCDALIQLLPMFNNIPVVVRQRN